MFLHVFKNRLKCLVRDKQALFFTLLFPIILGTLFNLAFQNLNDLDTFSKIKIAMVDNEGYKKDSTFQQVLTSVSGSEKDALFQVTYTSEENANHLLKKDKIQGYILIQNGLNLVIKEDGLYQNIMQSFLDDYKQMQFTIASIIKENPNALESVLQDLGDRNSYLKDVPPGNASPNWVLNYFYCLIAMTCLYGSFWGLKEVTSIQANYSPQGARLNMAPVHKLKVFAASVTAAVTLQFLEILVLLAYLIFILKIDFGNQLGYILLTCITSTVTGVTMGAMVSSLIKKGSENVKSSILIGVSMLMSFLSGLMIADLKYIINDKVPILSYLNPANLITDSFYSLYYFSTHERFFTNILLLWGFNLLFSLITYFVLRGQKYASL
ncbi:MAG: type transporter [Bacillales bacterium]|jgi:ABC-2 type transport system permease protein|nr:type transporter [Bacillales bacterium]